ncbi:hypothetical protein BDV96DRAFT_601147 [Lophiotrema nucula]|uniref:Uncharacterized protein n=1 Tax=Lophiotrema nucula TaxID=690887 RepID=A0A6A5Z449_9PLEO|nr:hypothetical protein BDV96DRAFT_601147 [Lophiotrema nucula]
MDHWGDPWADADADDADTKSPAKNEEVKTQPPPSPSPLPNRAPVVLNGFLDEAGWGAAEEEDDFGGWASSTNGGGFGHVADSETRAPEPTLPRNEDWTQESKHDNDVEEKDTHLGLEDEGWGALTEEQDFSSMSENVVSETSDSATTVQADEVPARHSLEGVGALNHDDDLSTRPSTSPSDISHTEAPTESPRTSFEDERMHRKECGIAATPLKSEESPHTGNKDDLALEAEQLQEEASDENGFGDFEDNEREGIQSGHEGNTTAEDQDEHKEQHAEVHPSSQKIDHPRASIVSFPAISGLDLDWSLINDLFPLSKPAKELPAPPEDPIHSTSTRKAWYRLTRKQTMREFNTGSNDDNYIRVTWANSRIKQDVIKTVGRWTNEGRMSGRGNAAGGFFNWDRPAAPAPNPVGLHVRKKSIAPVPVPIQPTKQATQPLATNVPAAFSWSSPMSSSDPWKQDSSTNRSVSSPTTPKHTAITRLQVQGPRSVSVDLTSRSPAQTSHKRTNTSVAPDLLTETPPTGPSSVTAAFVDERNLSNSGTSQQLPPPVTEAPEADVWGDIGALETPEQLQPSNIVQAQQSDIDDDEEWGEMVESPATPTLPSFPTNSTPAQQPSTATSSPAPTVPSSSPWASATARDALPVTRLKGAVSPTTANFKFNSFVPEGVIEGPIGPGLLKKSQSVQSTPEKGRIVPNSALKVEMSQNEEPEETHGDMDEADDFADFESLVPNDQPSKPLTPTLPSPAPVSEPVFMSTPSPAPPPEPPSDALDFSIFESNPPTSAPSQHHSVSDPSDPWSIFDTPPPPPPPAPEPEPFVRPPAKNLTPPPLQPLTGATNLAQKRKEEEDEIIQTIVNGLPDLTYMLRR